MGDDHADASGPDDHRDTVFVDAEVEWLCEWYDDSTITSMAAGWSVCECGKTVVVIEAGLFGEPVLWHATSVEDEVVPVGVGVRVSVVDDGRVVYGELNVAGLGIV